MKRVNFNKQSYYVDTWQILGTHIHVFAVYEKSIAWQNHTSGTYEGKQYMGKVDCRNLPSELECLPALTDIRFERVTAYQADLNKVCHAIILKAYPNLETYQKWYNSGEISVNDFLG